MSLMPEHLHEASQLVGAASSLRDAAALWRAHHPEIRALVVDAFDMRDEAPTLILGARRVYLAASDGHCWQVTQEPAQAQALILTEV